MNRNVIWMSKTEAKCVPTGPCPYKTGCARFLVGHDGRPVGDYTITGHSIAGVCSGLLPADRYRTPPASKDAQYRPADSMFS